MNKLRFFLALFLFGTSVVYAQSERVITASFNQVKSPKKHSYFKCIGAGRAAEGLRADWQKQLAEVQSTFAFEYIRFHGILHDDMGVCTEDKSKEGEFFYNFQYIDALYDFLLSVNIKPFVELSFMPKLMSSGDETVFWWKGNITPPKSMDRWNQMIDAFVRHLTKRYGAEQVATWYFEVWNEPNHESFFTGDLNTYLDLYKNTVQTIKAVNSAYRVGGPSTAGCKWIREIIEYCDKNNVPLDFLSTHAYGVTGALDEYGVRQLKLNKNPNVVSSAVNRVRTQMDNLNKKQTELHFTEWNTSYSPADLTHDTYLNAPYVLNVLRNTDTKVQSMSYWTFTDIFEEPGIPQRPFHGGFGLINLQGLKKPTYFAYKYLYQLGDSELVNNDKQSWVCKSDDGAIQVLAYNYTHPLFKKGEHNNMIFAVERKPKDVNSLVIHLNDIPAGKYRLEKYLTGYENNDVQTGYFRLGSPDILYPEQYDSLALMTRDVPLLDQTVKITKQGYSVTIPMRENDVVLLKLTPLH